MESDDSQRQLPVAIVGIGAFLPGSTDLEGCWRNLLTGSDLMTDVPPDRWLVEDYYDPDPRAIDKTYGKRGAFLSRVGFDPVSYGIPPNSLPSIDTSQLLALMVAEQVIADCAAGLPENRERVSVLLGASSLQLLVEASARLHRPVWLKAIRAHGIAGPQAEAICDSIAASYVPWQEETFPGLLTNVVSGRIANKFDLHGTNLTTDAACASSLAALHSAIAELSLHESDLVITGGVDTMNDVLMYTCFSATPALSPTGDCRPFAAAADGTMLGEGVVMFALKRLTDAERDGDRIYGVIRGVGTSSDGRGTAIYAPLPAGQMRALRHAYERAGYGPETVELVEAHGTGTSAGDAAEFAALRSVFDDSGREDRQWCAIGSIKSQIGHTKAAAGAAGLLKAVLALHHKVLPPTIKVDQPNPALELESSPFYLNTAARPWIRPQGGEDVPPRRASVSSFGFGGTNFHVTLEEYVPAARSPARPAWCLPCAPTELILISGPDSAALLDRARQLDPGRSLTDLARQTQQDFNCDEPARLAVVARDADDLTAKLHAAASAIENGRPLPAQGHVHLGVGPAAPGLVGFLFPGQGSQYVGMGADLAMHLPSARMAWDRAAALELGDVPLHQVVFPRPVFTEAERAGQEARLTATEWAQPALAVHSLALLGVLGGLGLAPVCVAGHSFGELVALHAAGAFDAETLVRLARVRGKLMRDASSTPGAMLAVTAGREEAEAAVADLPDLWLANHNGPSQVVFAGTRSALEAAATRLADRGVTVAWLNAATGFHSPLVASAAEPFLNVLRQAEVTAPALDAYAGRDAVAYPADATAVRDGLAAQIATPVRFVDVVEAMYERGVRTFVEVGPGAALTGLTAQILGDRQHLATSLDRRGRHGMTSLQDGLGRLAVGGVAINFAALWRDCAPAAAPGAAPQRRKTEVAIDGGNYGRPCPQHGAAASPNGTAAGQVRVAPASQDPPAGNGGPAPAHELPRSEPLSTAPAIPAAAVTPAARPTSDQVVDSVVIPSVQAVPVNGDPAWLRVLEEAQAQAAGAHAEFQRAITESHLSYLRMAEATLGALLGTADGRAPQVWPEPAHGPALAPVTSAPALPQADSAGVANGAVESAMADASPAAPAEHMDAESLGQLLLQVVADRTGYPVEMLNVDMELDTDLGIDSIKKVEILSVVRKRVGDLAGGDVASLATLRTLRAIAERVTAPAAVLATPAARATADAGPGQPAGPSPPDPSPVLGRWAVRAIEAPPSGLAMPGLTNGTIAVTDDRTGIAPLLVERLKHCGIRAEVVFEIPPDTCGVISLDGLRPVTSVAAAMDVQRSAFRAARAIAPRMQAGEGVFVTVQDTGGDFGLAGSVPAQAWLGGLAALARTAAKEWPQASVKAIDCAAAGRAPAVAANAIVTELLNGGGSVTAGLRDGTRLVPALVAAPAGGAGARIGPESVIVATGGARGVTAAAMRLLAARYRPRLALLGQTPLEPEPEGLAAATDEPGLIRLLAGRQPGTPAEIRAAARRILAVREIRGTLRAIEQTGSPVRYYAVNVTDTAAVADVLAEVRADLGPISGIVHGAGVLADALLADKTDEHFDHVFETKVKGLHSLLTATAGDPLDVLCAFSSVAAQLGNQGQSDYAMANEVLGHVLSAEAAHRPGCLVRSIGWGPWRGGMVSGEVSQRFLARGVPLIDLDEGAEAFLAEVGCAAGDVRVLVSAVDRTGPPALQDDISGQVTVAEPAYAYLADHRLAEAPVVPMATVLDWFARMALAWRPQASPVILRDLQVLSKISLPALADGGHELKLRGRQAGGDVLELDLRDEAGVPHYRARVDGTSGQAGPGQWDTPEGLVPLSEPYDGYTLFHGPRFQVLRGEPLIGLAGAEASVAGVSAMGWGGAGWRLDPAAIDGALQLAVLWARQGGTGSTLPMAIRECRVHRLGPAGDVLRCVVWPQRADDSAAACDVALIEGDGSARVELFGVELVRRPDQGQRPPGQVV